jgi:circadian clock protein KaiC
MNEYPFLIDAGGLSVFPITSLGLQHEAPLESIASGVPDLDRMLAGGGFYRGSSILVSGRAGTGKSSLAAAFVRAACDRNERCTYFAFEESPSQIMRNMRSIGIDLAPGVEQGLLRFAAQRPTACGLEEHLARVNAQLRDHRPAVVVVDPMTNLVTVGNPLQIRAMLNRLVDTLKQRRITALFTSLASGTEGAEQTSPDVSSLMDAWLALDVQECAGQRCRTLHVLKVRGRRHDTDRKWLQLGDDGVHLDDLDRCGAGPGDAAGGQPRPGGGPQS